ncbi:MAG: type II secretion system F family protein [Gammaproteobacteria bacterium]|nr:type II secretion system F family protein [Gammaproteobacteria bacterium]
MAIETLAGQRVPDKTPGSFKSTLSELNKIQVFSRKVGLADRMLFTERLGLMIETGTPLYGSLGTLKRSIANPAMADIIGRLEVSIDKGGSFAIALSQCRELFDSTYINLVAAGEKGGFLPDVMQQLYQMDKKRLELGGMVKSAMFYPFFLLAFSVAVIVFVMLVVFPKFATLFESLADRLPLSTKVLLAISDFMMAHWFMMLCGFALALVGMGFWWRKPEAMLWRDRVKLRLPLVREIIIQYYLLQTLRVLSLSIKNGVNVLDALKGCRDIVQNSVYQNFLQETAEMVETGDGISAGFEKSSLIPDLVKQMIGTGEETGNLALVMLRIAEHYEVELAKRIQTVSKLAEPIMLLIMGAFVGLLVSSLILPIFQLSRAVH